MTHVAIAPGPQPFPYLNFLPTYDPQLIASTTQSLLALYATSEAQLNAQWNAIVDNPLADNTRARISNLLASLERSKANVDAAASDYIANTFPQVYQAGADAHAATYGGTPFAWSQPHMDAVGHLANGLTDSLLGATSYEPDAIKSQIQALVKDADVRATLGGETATQAGSKLADQMRAQGIANVTYADGSVVSSSTYANMAVRTTTAIAYNAGGLNQATGDGVEYFEISDGDGCGLTYHDDPELADGMVVDADTAQEYPISHPNCVRSYLPRPDLTAADIAQLADSSQAAQDQTDAIDQAITDLGVDPSMVDLTTIDPSNLGQSLADQGFIDQATANAYDSGQPVPAVDGSGTTDNTAVTAAAAPPAVNLSLRDPASVADQQNFDAYLKQQADTNGLTITQAAAKFGRLERAGAAPDMSSSFQANAPSNIVRAPRVPRQPRTPRVPGVEFPGDQPVPLLAPLLSPAQSAANSMFDAMRTPDGGFTIDPRSGDTPTEGYAVAVSGVTSRTPAAEFYGGEPGNEAGRAIIAQWLEDNAAQFDANPNLMVGGWHDPATHDIVLDPAQVITDRATAIAAGTFRNEQAIADLHALSTGDAANAFIDTHGTGIGGPKYVLGNATAAIVEPPSIPHRADGSPTSATNYADITPFTDQMQADFNNTFMEMKGTLVDSNLADVIGLDSVSKQLTAQTLAARLSDVPLEDLQRLIPHGDPGDNLFIPNGGGGSVYIGENGPGSSAMIAAARNPDMILITDAAGSISRFSTVSWPAGSATGDYLQTLKAAGSQVVGVANTAYGSLTPVQEAFRVLANGQSGTFAIGGTVEAEQLLREAIVSDTIHRWAISSNDTDVYALAMQHAVSDTFGLSEGEGYLAMGKTYNQTTLAEVDAGATEVYASDGDVMRQFVDAMYQNTQAQFAALGYASDATIAVGRGWAFSGPGQDQTPPAWVGTVNESIMGARSEPVPTRNTVDAVIVRPASSWTVQNDTARNFHGGTFGFLTYANVPISRILGMPGAGFGCWGESEIVVIGDRMEAMVYRTGDGWMTAN